MDFKNGAKNIQDTTYNGAHTVDCCPKMCSYASQFKSNQKVNWLDCDKIHIMLTRQCQIAQLMTPTDHLTHEK